MGKLFGTDGIRGVANQYPLTIDVCEKLATALAKKYSLEGRGKVILGKDTRISCDIFEHALAAAFCSRGIDVKFIEVVPTPAVSILVQRLQVDLGIMVSASHNPFYDNGIKIFDAQGLKLSDSAENEIEKLIEQPHEKYDSQIFGRVEYDFSAIDFYVQKISDEIAIDQESASKLKIVLDCANGSLSKIAPKIFEKFGFNATQIYAEPSGTNINENCGAAHTENLAKKVVECKADLGIAFDGDGDRVIFVDENGKILDGDYILAVLAENFCSDLQKNVVSTVMSNFGFEKYLASQNIQLIRTQVGDRYVSEKMKEIQAIIGGEPSGHVIISSHAPTGDGLFTALKIIEYLIKNQKKCSEIGKIFELFPSVSRNVRVTDKSILKEPSIANKIEKSYNQLNGRGKLVVRPSGTEPLIRILAEGENVSELQQIVAEIENLLDKK